MPRTVIGVMGGGDSAPDHAIDDAYHLGQLIAGEGWVLLTGGRDVGVMDAASRGAGGAGGLVIGVLPDADTRRASPHLDVCICTGMGDGRNVINVLSSDVVIACAGGAGTISEVALALKSGKPVILLNFPIADMFNVPGLRTVSSPAAAIELARQLIDDRNA